MFTEFDIASLAVAVIIFLLAAGAVWALRRFEIKDSAIIVTLLVLPFAAYGIVSGSISELTGPGGWGAKFREVAAQDIDPTPLGGGIDDLRIVEKSSLAALEERRASLVPGKPLAMTLQLGRRGYYNDRAIASYSRTLLTFDSKLTIIFVDDNNRFVASTDGIRVIAAMDGAEQGPELVQAIENADLSRIRDLVGLTTSSVKADMSNAQALDMMLRDGVASIIATGDGGKPAGIVRRDDIVARLLVKLAAG